MVTIKQALTNRHGSSLCKTIVSLAPGEAFKWLPDNGNTRDGYWCVKLSHLTTVRVQVGLTGLTYADKYGRLCTNWETQQHLWTYIEGPKSGMIFSDNGEREVHQP